MLFWLGPKFVTHSAVRAKMEDILKPSIEMNKHRNDNYISYIHILHSSFDTNKKKRLWWMEDGEHRKDIWSSYKLLLRILNGKNHLTVQDIGERIILKWTLWMKLVIMWTHNFLDRWILNDCSIRTLSQYRYYCIHVFIC